MNLSLNLAGSIGSLFGAPQVKPDVASTSMGASILMGASTSMGASTPAASGAASSTSFASSVPVSSTPTAAATLAAISAVSATTLAQASTPTAAAASNPTAVATSGANPTSVSSTSASNSQGPSIPSSVGASAGASANVAGVASVDVDARISSVPAKLNLVRSAAKPSAAGNVDVERHFAIGMQESRAQFAADRLSQDGSDRSGAAASLEASEKRFTMLVSQITVASAPDDDTGPNAGPGPGPSATSGQVHEAYADA